MPQTRARRTLREVEFHIDTLECFLRESTVILRSLREQEGSEGLSSLHARRLSAAQRENDQLQVELEKAYFDRNRRFRQKTA